MVRSNSGIVAGFDDELSPIRESKARLTHSCHRLVMERFNSIRFPEQNQGISVRMQLSLTSTTDSPGKHLRPVQILLGDLKIFLDLSAIHPAPQVGDRSRIRTREGYTSGLSIERGAGPPHAVNSTFLLRVSHRQDPHYNVIRSALSVLRSSGTRPYFTSQTYRNPGMFARGLPPTTAMD